MAEQLASIPELGRGFDGIGFSQGGQFLRGYVERYDDPPVFNLITFGSQHMGISDIPECRTFDFLCEVARRAAKAGVYTEWAQKHLVQVCTRPRCIRDCDLSPPIRLNILETPLNWGFTCPPVAFSRTLTTKFCCPLPETEHMRITYPLYNI